MDRILLQHPQIYDSPDPDLRLQHSEDDLLELPLNEPGTTREVNIFDEDGRRIPRKKPQFAPGSEPNGLLANLNSIGGLFSQQDHRSIWVRCFPQAFLRDYGHCQSNTIPWMLWEHLFPIQQKISRRYRPHDSEDGFDTEGMDTDDDDLPPNAEDVRSVLQPVASQFYNHLSHRTRASNGLHDVQLGQLTATLAGTYAVTRQEKEKFTALLNKCKMSLPFERFDTAISVENPPRALRLENVWVLDVLSMRPSLRNGGYACNIIVCSISLTNVPRAIYREIICKLAQLWTRHTVVESIKPHLIVFKPHVGMRSDLLLI
jgi:hypothetical protein